MNNQDDACTAKLKNIAKSTADTQKGVGAIVILAREDGSVEIGTYGLCNKAVLYVLQECIDQKSEDNVDIDHDKCTECYNRGTK